MSTLEDTLAEDVSLDPAIAAAVLAAPRGAGWPEYAAAGEDRP